MDGSKLTSEFSIKSDFFGKLDAFLHCLFKEVDWDRKCRIVMEYNPAERTTIRLYEEQ